jgi:hypothetical protein
MKMKIYRRLPKRTLGMRVVLWDTKGAYNPQPTHLENKIRKPQYVEILCLSFHNRISALQVNACEKKQKFSVAGAVRFRKGGQAA